MVKINRLLTKEDFRISGSYTVESVFTNAENERVYITTDYKLKTAEESESGVQYIEYYHANKENARAILDLFLNTHMIVGSILVWNHIISTQLRSD